MLRIPASASVNAEGAREAAVECPVHVRDYHQAITLRGPSPKRLLLRAESACGDGVGLPLRLEKVTLTIESDGRRFTRLDSAHAFYSSARKRLVLDHVIGPVEPGCVGLASDVLVDLAQKTFRSADGWSLSLNSSWANLRCLQQI